MSKKILSNIQGCLMGIMIGDAMGAPCEVMTFQEIAKATNGGIKDFEDLSVFERRLDKGLRFKVGDTTDDWAFTKALTESLIVKGGYSHMDCARRFVEVYKSGVVGMGRTTRESLYTVKKFLDVLSGEEKQKYSNMDRVDLYGTFRRLINRQNYGNGAGVAMRIAPLAILSSVSGENLDLLYEQLRLNSSITHLNKQASDSACLVGCIIHDIFSESLGDIYSNYSYLKSIISEVGNEIEGLLLNWNKNKRTLLSEMLFVEEKYNDLLALKLKFCMGRSAFSALSSVAFSVSIFVRNMNKFRAGILEAVNAGGDTDTTASMVGAMLGAQCGLEGIPKEWRDFNPEFKEAEELGEKLYNLAFNK
ncbi:MAG: ADP-ribosylglycohydrolase family protein [Candidatus Magasanikbacteria bacterium]|nr:ADP-ribosylglycohydrolase family protein [Candidatus Magasanikbacteria bacterium]